MKQVAVINVDIIYNSDVFGCVFYNEQSNYQRQSTHKVDLIKINYVKYAQQAAMAPRVPRLNTVTVQKL